MTRTKTLAHILACLAALFSLAAAAEAGAKIDERVVEAFHRLDAGDYAAARAIVEPMAAEGDRQAQHMLGYLEQFGLGGPKNLQHAVDLYYKAALAGDADAEFALGELAFTGDGVVQDYARAADWFRLAAAHKHPGAQARLGRMHAEGLGVPKDINVAVSLLEEAADANDPGAQYLLGNAYFAGAGVKQDYRKAADWYRRAAEQGHADAQYNLALLYGSEVLGAPDLKETYSWMRAAAEGGIAEAYVALGLMADDGKTPEGEKAADWFEKGAGAGDPQGMILYAVALAKGDGRQANPNLALVWVDRVLARKGEIPGELIANARALREDIAAAMKAGEGR